MEKGLWNICFTNPKKFPDPYDSLMYKVPVRMGKDFVSQELLLKDVFISCWTKCKESELHWNCYGRDSKSVCVVSTPRKIMQYIYDFRLRGSYNFFFTGNVVYKNLFDVERKIKYTTWGEYKEHDYCIEQLFLKTKEHVNEKEIRFVFYDATNDGEKKSKLWRTNTEYAKVKVDCNKVFDEIIINPSLKEEDVDFMIAEIKNNGFTKSVRKSRLYDNPHIYIDVAPSIGDKC